MQDYYNMNQTTLSITLDYLPEENHPARYINQFVESLKLTDTYQFGRPREYDLGALLKLVLLAYSYGIFSSRQIERFARENKPAGWLVSNQVPSYRTICRFRISDELAKLTEAGLTQLTTFLRQNKLIDDVSFIDGTKILADANKYSFVWKKNTIRFDEMNREKLVELLGELHEAKIIGEVPAGSNLTPELLEMMISKVEDHLVVLEQKVAETEKVSPNPAKQKRRTFRAKKRKLVERRDKMRGHQDQQSIYGQRNSYSKTDHDATFMRVKEDPMQNGQLKPAYNLQIATSGQFITGYQLFQNPTDTRTLQPFIKHLQQHGTLGATIVADAGYGSESNYRFLEDSLPEHTALIPYGTMIKENSRKWKSDDRKVMNWDYYEADDYYVDSKGVRFNFKAYRKRTDKYGFIRDFKEYVAEKLDENQNVISEALTPKGNLRRIQVNSAWEYFKAKQRDLLSTSQTAAIYAQRKIDVEPIFGKMKASLRFHRFSVRGLDRVRKEAGIVIMALNIQKLVTLVANSKSKRIGRENKDRFLVLFHYKETSYVTASCTIFVMFILFSSWILWT
ncbi:IS1182 family transposase [Levilactobacillus brevis]|uniref:IS1182 family transposase n=6 Tax=Levilactobacillus brevis TaxID=1580 RepID=UPI00063A898E|nr:IS1182 family transposase [Levilactobacillus brevis]KLE29336.1 transposase [Levilactobacillus brevis]MDM5047436.1 IS1182 family transposase [Levilactobacillus brevis]QOX68154.1 IS1182 family transposase [Levilactobacillus brevis]